jgi:hypothetical protein
MRGWWCPGGGLDRLLVAVLVNSVISAAIGSSRRPGGFRPGGLVESL